MRRLAWFFAIALLGAVLILPQSDSLARPVARSGQTMRSIGSDYALKKLIRKIEVDQQEMDAEAGGPPPPPPPAAPPPPMSAPAMEGLKSTSVADLQTSLPNVQSITNNQTQGVDEGGIVKQHGKHLIVLRRGRLFSIDSSGPKLTLSDRVDAFPPFHTGGGAWYDEMLVSGDLVVVIGYNYARAGTEVNRFKIDAAGKFTLVDTYHLRSQDYYSAENYASRLVGHRLIVYTPLYINREDPLGGLPGLRRWAKDEDNHGRFTRTAMARDIYVPDLLLNMARPQISMYHSVTSCDLTAPELACRSQVVLGSYSRTFYVGQDAVYVWTGNLSLRRWNDQGPEDPRGLLYRMPLDGSAPQAAVVWGGPINQFSMRSDPDGTFHALVVSDYGGDAMWEPVRSRSGSLALLTLGAADFGRGAGKPRKADYTPLPGGAAGNIENRFVGNHLVYAVSGSGGYYDGGQWRQVNAEPAAYAVELASKQVTKVPSSGVVSRIDQMGRDAILIGNGPGGALRFQALAFDKAGGPAIVDRYDLPSASEGESRSQAFFFRQDNADGSNGILGLPINAMNPPGVRSAFGYRAGIFFMWRKDRHFDPAGTLYGNPVSSAQDMCKASCVDWYGNARPIFLGGRIFALMGYELVEGRADGQGVAEVQRLDFNPAQDQQRH